MTRARLLVALTALCLTGFTATAMAQDEPSSESQAVPEGADTENPAAADASASTVAAAPEQTAPAETPSGPSKPVSISLLLGYGISLESGANPWGLGFGLRGGYNIGQIYLGPRFVYYLGASQNTGFGKVTANIWELGLEGGYDLQVADKFVLRPMLGLGIASFHTSLKVSGISGGITGAPISGSGSKSYFQLAPGIAALYDLSESAFIGLDARFGIVFGNQTTVKGLLLLANGGMRF